MIDFTDGGFLGYLESEGHITQVANVLNKSPNDTIDTEEFRKACITAGVDPDSFTEYDLKMLQRKLR